MTKPPHRQMNKFGSCPFATAQKLIAGKWAILIMRTLAAGARRFGEIQKEVGATQATLATQLKTLEYEGLLTRTAFPEVPPRVEYELTPIGYAFTPVLDCIEVWGNSYIDYLHQHTTQAESLPQEEPTLSSHNER